MKYRLDPIYFHPRAQCKCSQVWSATKAAAASVIMLGVLGLLGFILFSSGVFVIFLAFLGGLAFGAIGMFFTGITPTIDMFNLPIFLFITPMFLFSGTFFPVSSLPGWARTCALAFPLYHLVELTRRLCIGSGETAPAMSVLYLAVFSIVFLGLSLRTMRRRLIQ